MMNIVVFETELLLLTFNNNKKTQRRLFYTKETDILKFFISSPF